MRLVKNGRFETIRRVRELDRRATRLGIELLPRESLLCCSEIESGGSRHSPSMSATIYLKIGTWKYFINPAKMWGRLAPAVVSPAVGCFSITPAKACPNGTSPSPSPAACSQNVTRSTPRRFRSACRYSRSPWHPTTRRRCEAERLRLQDQPKALVTGVEVGRVESSNPASASLGRLPNASLGGPRSLDPPYEQSTC